jgi:hypothetical protein
MVFQALPKMFSALLIGEFGKLAMRQLQYSSDLLVHVGSVRRRREFFLCEQLGDIGFGHVGRTGKIPLSQSQLFQSIPDEERNVHKNCPYVMLE